MNFLILAISALIYASFGLQSFLYMFVWLLISFGIAQFLNKENKYRKIILGITIIINVTFLLLIRFEKYTKIGIIAPLGVSYYTLQVISYLIDVYKEKYEAEKNLLYYALYIMYIPHLFIGPIIRYDEMKDQILTSKRISLNNIYDGGLRIALGLIKKLIIAGRIAIVIESIKIGELNGAYAFLAMLLYSIQLYNDFSGGIDIVLGISKIFNINLSENFNSPFLSQNVKEFWRRWHISLSLWLKDYVYIPLGGNKCKKFRKTINVLITFIVSGIWHGSGYILWGICHGILTLLGDKYNTKNKWINRIINFVIVSLLWAFFIWDGNQMAISMIISVFTNINIVELYKNIFSLGLNNIDWIILIIFSICVFIYETSRNKINDKTKNLLGNTKLIFICIMILIVLTFGIYGIGFNVNEFIYSKF